MIRFSYACAVGQWLHVKTTTRIFASAKSLSEYVFPSTPINLKSGAEAPMSSVLGLSAAHAQLDRQTRRGTNHRVALGMCVSVGRRARKRGATASFFQYTKRQVRAHRRRFFV